MFSAGASFAVAVILAVIGFMTLKAAKARCLLLLALIPLLFAFQQLTSGILQLFLESEASNTFKYVYLFVPFILWPVWIPLSLAIPEKIRWRKALLVAFMLCGILIDLFFLKNALGNEVSLKFLLGGIQYNLATPLPIDEWIVIGIYTLIVVVPLFLSSLYGVWALGALSLAAWLIAEFFFHDTFVSAWSFFCAIASACLYFVIKANAKENTSNR